jgi:hypothetical protein
VEDNGIFNLNYFSFVGLEFVKLGKYVSKADFLEILPYIHHDYLYSNKNLDGKMDIEVFLRFITVNFVSAFLKKDIIFDAKSIDFEIEVRRDSVEEQLTKIDKKLFSKVISAD